MIEIMIFVTNKIVKKEAIIHQRRVHSTMKMAKQKNTIVRTEEMYSIV